jgi:hypothetical protein
LQSGEGVELRCRGFFLPMLSIVGHPSGDKPLMVDVRQSGSGPGQSLMPYADLKVLLNVLPCDPTTDVRHMSAT